MTTSFPTSLDNLSNPNPTDVTGVFGHAALHSNENDAIEAIQAKVGINGSAVTTTHDYKLSEVTGSDKAVSKTATQTLTNKTLTSPTITGATQSGSTITTSSINGVTPSTSAGATNYLAGDGTYKAVQAPDASYSVKGSVQGLTDAATSGLTLSSGVISVNSGTGANQIVKLDGTSKLPALNGSNLTNIMNVSQVSSIFTTTASANGRVAPSDMAVYIGNALISYTKYKEFVYNDAPGTIRMYITISFTGGGFPPTTNWAVYKNGSLASTPVTNTSGSGSYNFDISVSTGDLVQLYANCTVIGSGITVKATNVYIAYDKTLNIQYQTNTTNL